MEINSPKYFEFGLVIRHPGKIGRNFSKLTFAITLNCQFYFDALVVDAIRFCLGLL